MPKYYYKHASTPTTLASVARALLAAILALAAAVAPARAAPPLAAYGKLPAVELAVMSPSGNRIAVVGVVGEARRLVVFDPGNKALRAQPLGDHKVRHIAFADEDRLLVWVSQTRSLGPGFTLSKYELTGVLVVDLAAKRDYPVMKRGATFGGVTGSYGVGVIDGKPVGFFSAITLKASELTGGYNWDNGNSDLYRIDLLTGADRIVAKAANAGLARDWLVGPDGTPLVALDQNRDSGRWKLRNLVSDRELADGAAPAGGVSLVSLGRTAGTAIFTRPDAEGDREWLEIDLATGAIVPFLPDITARALHTERNSQLLIGYTTDADVPETRFFDARRQARMKAVRKAVGDLNIDLVSASDDFDRLLVRTDGNGDPGTWWRVDIKAGTADPVGRGYPAVKDTDVGPIRMVKWQAGDGQAIEGVLTLPPGGSAKHLPLIALPHGGPSARDYPSFDWWAQALASRGYAVLQPNFRGSTGYGDAFERAGHGQWGKAMQTDISDGVAELARQGIADPKRVCIMGASYGGYAALAGVTLQNGVYRCAVSVAGVGDLAQLFAHNRKASGGTDKVTLRAWEKQIGVRADLAGVSPAAQAAKADAPVLLIHGRDDTVVPFAQSERMAARLKAAGKPVEMVTLAGEDHWLSRETTRVAMLEAAVAFVEKHNPPDRPGAR